MKSIAVIGQGFVGGSLTTVFSERGFGVYAYDKAGKYAKGSLPSHGDSAAGYPGSIAELIGDNEGGGTPGFTNVYFVCLPTPMYEDGSADLSIVDGVLSELASIPGERIAVVKSTVPPGSVEEWNKKYGPSGLHVVFNPEFLTEANALNDMRNQNRIILGGPRPWVNEVKQVFESAFPGVPIVKTSSTIAEMVKYMTNNFLTVKVAFANEMAQICEALDKKGLNVDYDKVVEYAKYDQRLGNSHWSVPGPDGNRGFGGHCFPKDVNAMISVAKGLGVEPKVLSASWEKNLEVRQDRDWEKQVGRAVSKKNN
jgi:UDPglucose 6-dehydrogenase